MLNEYALYKGEEILCIGTIKEIANNQGVLEKSVRYLTTGAYKKRLSKRKKSTNSKILIRLEDD